MRMRCLTSQCSYCWGAIPLHRQRCVRGLMIARRQSRPARDLKVTALWWSRRDSALMTWKRGAKPTTALGASDMDYSIERLGAAMRSQVTRGKVTQSIVGPRTMLQVTGLDLETVQSVEHLVPPG